VPIRAEALFCYMVLRPITLLGCMNGRKTQDKLLGMRQPLLSDRTSLKGTNMGSRRFQPTESVHAPDENDPEGVAQKITVKQGPKSLSHGFS